MRNSISTQISSVHGHNLKSTIDFAGDFSPWIITPCLCGFCRKYDLEDHQLSDILLLHVSMLHQKPMMMQIYETLIIR
jgi:hypothetical protein